MVEDQIATVADILLGFIDQSQTYAIISTTAERLKHCKPDAVGFATASLLAKLLHDERQVEAIGSDHHQRSSDNASWLALIDFLSKAIRENAPGSDTLREVMALCHYPEILHEVVSRCSGSLNGAGSKPFASALETVAAQTPAHSELDKQSVPQLLTISESQALFVLKALSHSTFGLPVELWLDVVSTLYSVIESSASLQSTATSTLLSVLQTISIKNESTAEEHGDDIARVWELAWKRTIALAQDHNSVSDSHNAGLAIWLRMIRLSPDFFALSKIMINESYWSTLLKSLAHGTPDGKKITLAIFRLSYSQLQANVRSECFVFLLDEREEYLKQYERFCTLFETVVLNRYLNQVLDSMADLARLSHYESNIRKHWIVALMTAALGKAMQDSVRKIIGPWVFHSGAAILAMVPTTAAEFLTQSLLPWATSGSLFTSTVITSSRSEPQCTHGGSLSSFLTSVLQSQIDRQNHIRARKAILNYLDNYGGHMIPFARAFVIDGLQRGTVLSGISLSAEEVRMVVKLGSPSNFPEICRDLMTCQLAALIDLAKDVHLMNLDVRPLLREANIIQNYSHDIPSTAEHLKIHRTRAKSGESRIHNDSVRGNIELDNSKERLSETIALLESSGQRCLLGTGLFAATKLILDALDENPSSKVKPHDLYILIQAVWEQAEIQEFPKSVMMQLPSVCLNQKSIESCGKEAALGELITEILIKLQKLAYHRIYIFPPLASSLRKACLVTFGEEVLGIEEMILNFANHPPMSKVEFQLEAILARKLSMMARSRSYATYYGDHEAYGYACIFDCLNNLIHFPHGSAVAKKILDKLLLPWLEQKRPVQITSKWKTTLQLQFMVLAAEAGIQDSENLIEVVSYQTQFMDVLSIEPMPRFRYLLEWISSRLYVRFARTRNNILNVQKHLGISNPKQAVSVMKIALMLSRLPDATEEFAQELSIQLICLAASPKIAVRHEAQWSVTELWLHSVRRDWKLVTGNTSFSALYSYIVGLENYQKSLATRSHELFDPITDHTLTNLCEGSYLSMEPLEEPRTRRADFLAIYEREGRPQHSSNQLSSPSSMPLGDQEERGRDVKPNPSAPSLASLYADQNTVPLQTKATQVNIELLRAGVDRDSSRGDVILIASLVDSAWNLGGLSRVAEIFGARAMHVGKLDVTKSKEFSSTSVSSQFWLPIEQLDVDSIRQFLTERKLEGYTVFGIEQTDSSKVLGEGDWRFPDKVVFVLGSEKEGIPAHLLSDMDDCVEIRQAGVTRSLNVQTAAAVALYEHSRQRWRR